jgi:RNA polymerase primary sigma factor
MEGKEMKETKTQKKNSNSCDANVLSMYLKEINTIPLLSREEENAYALEAAKGSQQAKNTLIQGNLRFVVSIAKRYQNKGLPLLDLISEGNLGLIAAIDHYDVEKGYHFISYAVWWIRQSILKAICEKSRMIRLPLNRSNELQKIEKARNFIAKNVSMDADLREIAEFLGMDAAFVNDLINISRECISLETTVSNNTYYGQLGDSLESQNYQLPEEYAIEQGLKADINSALKILDIKQQGVLRLRFGLDTGKGMSLREIGKMYNLTKERIRQIEKSALRRLSESNKAEALLGYVA